MPSLVVLKTISLYLQPGSNRQSDHATYTLPDLSISAEGRGTSARMPPCGTWRSAGETITVALQLLPPLVEMKDLILKGWVAFNTKPRIGTTTLPLGRTTGCPPMPKSWLAVSFGGPQVSPPLWEV